MVSLGDRDIPWQAGLTVATLLAELQDGHRYVVVKLNGKLVSRPHFASTPVPDGSRVTPIPMIAGG
jgi:thiamine biosynthesis protein ThiS